MNDLTRFIKSLKQYDLTRQQARTLKGQALNGDLKAAQKGLAKLIRS